MTATNPAEAVGRFVEHLRRATGCITPVPLVAQPTDSADYHVIFSGGRPVEVRTTRGHPPLKFSVVLHCHPVPHPMMADTFTVRSTYYAHEILDIEEAEILTYHWHPAGVSQVTRPHLHLSSSIGDIPIATFGRSPASIRLADMHILTGRILLEDVIRLLITEFRVEPLRRDWDDALTRSSTATLRDLP